MKILFKFLVILAVFTVPTMAATAEDFPIRPVRIITIDSAGSTIDVVARIVGEALAARLKQPVIIENRPGAAGMIAANAAAKATPDGYTLFMTGTFTEVIVPFAADKLPYDYKTDLVPVAEMTRLPFVLMVSAESKLNSFQDIIALARTKPGGLNVGGGPVGSTPNLTWELVARELGIKSTYIPYVSSGLLQANLLGGQLDIGLDGTGSAYALMQAGKVRTIAVTSATRANIIPATPTLQEVGIKKMDVVAWIGALSPKGVPADRLKILEAGLLDAVRSKDVIDRLTPLGYIPTGAASSEFRETILRDRARIEPLIRELGIRLN